MRDNTNNIPATQQRNMANSVEMFRHGQRALQLGFDNQPARTKQTYHPKQIEWNVSSYRPRQASRAGLYTD